ALFITLKTKHSTPKYGLVYLTSLIGKASQKHKGKISLSLATKTTLVIYYDGKDNSIATESQIKVENLGNQLVQQKGKPKIEVYGKDKKKGDGALTTHARRTLHCLLWFVILYCLSHSSNKLYHIRFHPMLCFGGSLIMEALSSVFSFSANEIWIYIEAFCCIALYYSYAIKGYILSWFFNCKDSNVIQLL
ncbi:hypothetical protein ACJX0J_014751, partial [Zea mays]